jgi:uncharacterized DUF497 family protein
LVAVDFSEIMWTEESENHISRHGVEPREVTEATERPYYAMPGRDDTTYLYGRTYDARHLFVVFSEAADGRAYVVTARDMTPGERRTYNRNAN